MSYVVCHMCKWKFNALTLFVGSTYPPQIKAFAGKEITLRIELNDNNIILSSTVFYVVDTFDFNASSSSRTATTMITTQNSNFEDVKF